MSTQAAGWRSRIVGHGEEAPDQLLANPRNWRVHPRGQQEALAGVLSEVGWVQDVIVNRTTGHVVDGHARISIAISKGEASVPVVYVELDPEEEAKVLASFDPLGAMAGADKAQLDALLQEVRTDDAALRSALRGLADDNGLAWGGDPPPGEAPEAEVDRAEELREKWQTKPGQLWTIGRHRLLCGDCTTPADVARLLDGKRPDMLLTDPPYCSGGFQEAGRKSGSVGTRGDELIANDTLSTRGYQSLMKQMLTLTPSGIAYVFTDWRMWVNLFDLVEGCGFGVRNMIVWDKGSPGMGVGWRMQHELIMCGVRVSSPFSPHKAQGNVIQAKRTGNIEHATEKPVDLLARIIDVTDLAGSVYDPFAGSGPTLAAAEAAGKDGFGMELMPEYVAVTLERLSRMGLSPRLEDGG